jgi:hypothetical protein
MFCLLSSEAYLLTEKKDIKKASLARSNDAIVVDFFKVSPSGEIRGAFTPSISYT